VNDVRAAPALTQTYVQYKDGGDEPPPTPGEPPEPVGVDGRRVPRRRGPEREARGLRGPHPRHPLPQRQPRRGLLLEREPLPRLLSRVRLLLRAPGPRVPVLRRGDRLRAQDRDQASRARAAPRGLRRPEVAGRQRRLQRRDRLLPAARGELPADAWVPRGLRRVPQPGRRHLEGPARRARHRRHAGAHARRALLDHGERALLGRGQGPCDRAVRDHTRAAGPRDRAPREGRSLRSSPV
jgi:hypothetical protein